MSISRLLKLQADTSRISSTALGSAQASNARAASGQAEGILYILGHSVVCIAVAKLGLQASEEVFFAIDPGDDQLDTCDGFSILVGQIDLQQAWQVGITKVGLFGKLEGCARCGGVGL